MLKNVDTRRKLTGLSTSFPESGSIDFQEFCEMMDKMAPSSTADILAETFSAIDTVSCDVKLPAFE